MNSILATIQKAANVEDAVRVATVYIVKWLARLSMVDTESVQLTRKSIASHGLDSMIGAEFRNWTLREFKVNIPFQQLPAGSLTATEPVRMLCERIRKS